MFTTQRAKAAGGKLKAWNDGSKLDTFRLLKDHSRAISVLASGREFGPQDPCLTSNSGL